MLKIRTDPIQLILNKSIFELPNLRNDFEKALKEIWGFPTFKPMLDLCATKCAANNLMFKVSNKRFFEMDEGNCKTIITPVGAFFNKFRHEKKFEISIKKMSTEVIVHEVAHMIEQACDLDITEEFASIMVSEIQSAMEAKSGMAKSAINQVLIDEVKGYSKSHIASELFARIYQLVAQSKEIYGYAADFAFSYDSICQTFPKTLLWIKQNIDPIVESMNDAEIVKASTIYQHKEGSKPNASWSHKRVKTFYKHSESKGIGKKWSSNVESIKD